MEITNSLNATILMVTVSTVILLFLFIVKKKRKSSGEAEIFECGENSIGSAVRQYRVEMIYSIIRDVVLVAMAMILFLWIRDLIKTDSVEALIGTTVTAVVWLITYLYTFSIKTEDC